jgi:hypothetical protein
MTSTQRITGLILVGALAATPAFAQDGRRRRSGSSDRQGAPTQQQSPRSENDRAVPRSRDNGRQNDARQNEARQSNAQRQDESRRQEEARRQSQVQRQYTPQRQYDNRRGYDARRDYGYGRPSYSNRGYGGSRTVIVPRIIRPSIVTIVPYRPYVYRPSIGIGVYYGTGGSYPYGYTPRGYYDPIPGRAYGGVRIAGAPRDAQVFADGYYVGIVNDFDGVFQHMNLEAGPHHIEIEAPGYDEPIAFDIMVQPGRTITFRADMY